MARTCWWEHGNYRFENHHCHHQYQDEGDVWFWREFVQSAGAGN